LHESQTQAMQEWHLNNFQHYLTNKLKDWFWVQVYMKKYTLTNEIVEF